MNRSGILIFLISLTCISATDPSEKAAMKPAGNFAVEHIARQTPVVIEIFTSEGCSSCPAADDVMNELIASAEDKGHPVYIVDFHVDYFDKLGWKDSLASPANTARQYRYVELFKLAGAYTPQAIINGRQQSGGSDDVKLNRLIGEQMKASPKARIVCEWKKNKTEASLTVDYKLAGDANNCQVNCALLQKKVVHEILRGENAGKTLSHSNVVRRFEQADVNGAHGSVTLSHIPQNLGDYRLLVYVQNKTTLEIIAASQLKLDD